MRGNEIFQGHFIRYEHCMDNFRYCRVNDICIKVAPYSIITSLLLYDFCPRKPLPDTEILIVPSAVAQFPGVGTHKELHNETMCKM